VKGAVQAVKVFTPAVYLLLDFVFPFTLCETNALHFLYIYSGSMTDCVNVQNTTVSSSSNIGVKYY